MDLLRPVLEISGFREVCQVREHQAHLLAVSTKSWLQWFVFDECCHESDVHCCPT